MPVWATHGALPHRAPCTRCTADLAHHVWYRYKLPTLSSVARICVGEYREYAGMYDSKMAFSTFVFYEDWSRATHGATPHRAPSTR